MTISGKGPVFICGHPRAGSTALYECLRQHPEFINDRYFDKEAKFFQQIIGDRPWGAVPTINTRHENFEQNQEIDRIFVTRAVRMTHELLSEYMGGPNGRYLLAFPYDVFNIPYILEAEARSKFVVILREPIANVWSMLNYPYSNDWHPNSRPTEGYYDERDIWNNFLRWSQPYWTLSKFINSRIWTSIKIVPYEKLAADVEATMLDIFQFIGVEPAESSMKQFKRNIYHSSFEPDSEIADGQLGHSDPKIWSRKIDERICAAVRHPAILKACAYYLQLAKMPLSQLGFHYSCVPEYASLSRPT